MRADLALSGIMDRRDIADINIFCNLLETFANLRITYMISEIMFDEYDQKIKVFYVDGIYK